MPQALQDWPSNATLANNGSSRSHRRDASIVDGRSNSADAHLPIASQRGAVSKLTMLLEADPLDLTHVGDAIRAHPDLESLILKVCDSLALTLGFPVCGAEEAAIVLGRDRLRILVRAWSARQFGESSGGAYASGILAGDLLLLVPFVESMLLTPEQRAALQGMLQLCR